MIQQNRKELIKFKTQEKQKMNIKEENIVRINSTSLRSKLIADKYNLVLASDDSETYYETIRIHGNTVVVPDINVISAFVLDSKFLKKTMKHVVSWFDIQTTSVAPKHKSEETQMQNILDALGIRQPNIKEAIKEQAKSAGKKTTDDFDELMNAREASSYCVKHQLVQCKYGSNGNIVYNVPFSDADDIGRTQRKWCFLNPRNLTVEPIPLKTRPAKDENFSKMHRDFMDAISEKKECGCGNGEEKSSYFDTLLKELFEGISEGVQNRHQEGKTVEEKISELTRKDWILIRDAATRGETTCKLTDGSFVQFRVKG